MLEDRAPLVSVVIATKNRAEMLRESIGSVLKQTFRDFELIIVDDGSEDSTREVVQSIGDPRIRYLYSGDGGLGISGARNLAAKNSRGYWTAVHDDDDLMLPSRLERQLQSAGDESEFIFGSFINFDDRTGRLELHHGRNMTYGAAIKTGFAPGHSTWLVKTELIRRFGYDEGLESAVDNNLAFRMLRAGVRFEHSGAICLLRRVHTGRITDTGGAGQKYAASLNRQFLATGINSKSQKKLWDSARYDWGPTDKTNWQEQAKWHLPDHLVVRAGWAYTRHGKRDQADEISSRPVAHLSLDEVYSVAQSDDYTGEMTVRMRETDLLEQNLPKQVIRKSPGADFRAILHYCRSNLIEPGYVLIASAPAGVNKYVASDAKRNRIYAAYIDTKRFDAYHVATLEAAAELQNILQSCSDEVRVYEALSVEVGHRW